MDIILGFILVIYGIFCIIKMRSESIFENYPMALFYVAGGLFGILVGILIMLGLL